MGKLILHEIADGIMIGGQVNGGKVSEGKIMEANITGADIQKAVLKNANLNEVTIKVGNGPTHSILSKVPIIGNFLQKINPFKR